MDEKSEPALESKREPAWCLTLCTTLTWQNWHQGAYSTASVPLSRLPAAMLLICNKVGMNTQELRIPMEEVFLARYGS